jgi:hypothetical protein
MRVHTVYVEGLQLHIPPKEERQQVQDLRANGAPAGVAPPKVVQEPRSAGASIPKHCFGESGRPREEWLPS